MLTATQPLLASINDFIVAIKLPIYNVDSSASDNESNNLAQDITSFSRENFQKISKHCKNFILLHLHLLIEKTINMFVPQVSLFKPVSNLRAMVLAVALTT